MNLFSVSKTLFSLVFGLFIGYTATAQDSVRRLDGIFSSLDVRVQAETSENEHKIDMDLTKDRFKRGIKICRKRRSKLKF